MRDIVNDNGCDLVEGRRWGRNSPAFGNLFNVPLSHRGGLVGPNRAGLHEKARELFADINARTLSDDSISCGLSEWNCQQLADEADLLKDALAVASEQRAGDKVAHLKAETEAVHKERTLKKCNA